jgi:dihydropteroate synthase
MTEARAHLTQLASRELPRPWQLEGWELPHHALPLANGLWRAPLLGEDWPATEAASPSAATAGDISRRDALRQTGLDLKVEKEDGSGCYRVDWSQLALTFNGRTAKQITQVAPGSPLWIAARIYLAAHAWLRFPKQPYWMVILNLTPDSFSDGGKWLNHDGQLQTEQAVAQAKQAMTAGATWLDLGAESTRPGADEISAEHQLNRLLPAIEALLPLTAATDVGISIDTRNANVADACLKAGATMINDVSGFGDPAMPQVCAAADCPTVLMHMRGTPATMQQHCEYQNLIGQIADEMAVSAAKGMAAGLSGERILLDPGIGFSKTAGQNYELIAHSDAFRALGFPLLLGPSRKSFLAAQFPDLAAADRDCATAGAAAICAQNGAEILRLHSGEHWQGILVAARLGATKNREAHPYNDEALTHC